MKGHTFKRCPCGPLPDERGRRTTCRKKHGTWVYIHELPPGPDGRRRQRKVGGFATERDAREAMNESIALLRSGVLPVDTRLRVGQYLDEWLAGKAALRPSTQLFYRQNIDLYLKPALGHLKLADLSYRDIEQLYEAMRQLGREPNPDDDLVRRLLQARVGQRPPRPLSDARIRRVHATLMAALNSAVRRRVLPSNPARLVELTPGRRPRAVVWTDEEVEAWHRSGKTPAVAVWTAEQTGRFLDHAQDDRLYPLFHLIAYRGLRRGEAVGLRWQDVSLELGVLSIRQQVVQLGWKTSIGEPKTASGQRRVPLDRTTVAVLRRWRQQQLRDEQAWGEAYQADGYLFTREDGRLVHPDLVSDTFRRLSREAGLPPIRLHDLRHTSASLALAAGVPMKVVSEMLGHSSLAITADTYTSVLPEVGQAAAEAVAQIVPRATLEPSDATDEPPLLHLDDASVAIPLPLPPLPALPAAPENQEEER